MSEEKKNLEIRDDELNAVSGGVVNAVDIRWCPECGKVMTPVYRMINGAMSVGSYACKSCDYVLNV